MDKVKIIDLPLVGETDKGTTFKAHNEYQEDFLLINRKAGTLNGCHFHKGFAFSKAPEILYMIQGEADLYCEDLQSGQEAHFQLKPHSRVEIFPWVWHELKAQSDITFLEMNSLEAHQKDTFYKKEKYRGSSQEA